MKTVRKILKIATLVLLVIFALPNILYVVPIKFCISDPWKKTKSDFYILQHWGNYWYVYGDLTTGEEYGYRIGVAEPEIPTKHGGFRFEEKYSQDLIKAQSEGTMFIVYGTAKIEYYTDEKTGEKVKKYIIDEQKADVYLYVETNNQTRKLVCPFYLTVYDYFPIDINGYFWFDYIRDKIYGYLDGATNW